MHTELDELRHQSEEHPLVPTSDFPSLATYVLYLMHRAAYEEAARRSHDADVLDLGCNNGYGTLIVAQHSRSTIGVDVSPSAVQSAQRHNSRENVQYQTIDGLGLPFEDDAFDLVTSFQVLEHITNVERYLSEVRRVLKPGGTALLTTPNRSIRLDPGMKPWNEFHVREYEAAELHDVLNRFFTNVEIRGLFATPAVYDVEYARVQRARADGRKRDARTALKRLLPTPLLTAVRKMRSTAASPNRPAQQFTTDEQARYSTADFWYSDEELDRALDLLAVCR